MVRLPAEVVRDGLKAYAERGIFQEFRETAAKRGKTRFEFLLLDEPVTIELAAREGTLVMRDLLQQVPAGMYADLQAFLASLFDRDLPPHRRLDRRSADARFVRRRGRVSLVLTVKNGRYRYAADKLVSLSGWLRTHLQQHHPAYLWEVAGESEG